MTRRGIFPPLALAVLVPLLAPCGAAADAAAPPAAPRLRPWSQDTLDQAARLAVQEHGRVKPLDTVASFALLRMQGKRTLKLPKGELYQIDGADSTRQELTPIEFLLECLFFPEDARRLPVFRVNTREVVDAIGVHLEEKEKRDRYSYAELLPGFEKLISMGSQYSKLEEKQRDGVQNQIVALYRNVNEFEAFTRFLDFARTPLPLEGSTALQKIHDGRTRTSLSDLTARLPQVIDLAQRVGPVEQSENADDFQALERLFRQLDHFQHSAGVLALIPPREPDPKTPWLAPIDVLHHAALTRQPAPSQQVAVVAALETLVESREDAAAFQSAFADLARRNGALAEARGEYAKIPLEVTYHRADFFYRALALYLLSFLLAAFSWLKPGARVFGWLVPVSLLPPTGFLVAGIVVRCILRERPPVSTLYETILFITACGVIVALVIEWINRQRIAAGLASVLGTAGVFLANKFEAMQGEDTMPQLQAVLDTNFWLATHVTTVVIGYAAGLLAAFLGAIYLLLRLFGRGGGDPLRRKAIARMVYGVICFGLLFSVLGTILGGIWANDSWGRFWGWDPKENGALMICLWELTMLHGRMGGYLKDHAFSMAAVFGGIIVSFSWWHVNLLGVGLHSYGFTAGILTGLYTFYGLSGLVLMLGFLGALRPGLFALPARPEGRVVGRLRHP